MATGKQEWPQSLKDFANRCFTNATDANRAMVQEELRALIYKCYTQGTIQSTDWETVQLESLKSVPSTSKAGLAAATAKTKKRPALAPTSDLSLAERQRREKRAKRFDRDKALFDAEEERGVLDPQAVAGVNGQQNGMGVAGFYYDTTGTGQHPQGMAASMGRGLAGRLGAKPAHVAPSMPPPLMGPGMRSGNGMSATGPQRRMGQMTGGVDAAIFAGSETDPNVIDWDQDTVVGLSTKLEKPYLRLTSAPDPRNVRTLPTLMQTLEFLKKKWRTEGNYSYICDQFKSMRQDLTVQRIKNDFTVKVYEIHARIALEKGDLGEYNQCQSQLRALYAHGIPGSVTEFLAYRILYLLHTRNRRDVNRLMAELGPAHKREPAVAHALGIRSALATGNYHAFFRLYDEAPNMNAYIIDHFIDRERVNALYIMAKSFRPSLPLTFLSSELSFADVEETHDFLSKHAAASYVLPAANGPASQPNKSKKATPHPKLPKLEERMWDAKAAQASLEAARVTVRAIDIKGQI